MDILDPAWWRGLPWDVISGLATALATLIGAAAIVVSFKQLRTGLEANRSAAALEAYREYLATCVACPELTSLDVFNKKYPDAFPRGIEDDESNLDVQRYFWFVSILMNTVEHIATYIEFDEAWRSVIKMQLEYHKPTLVFLWPDWKDGYGPAMVTLVEEVIYEPLQSADDGEVSKN